MNTILKSYSINLKLSKYHVKPEMGIVWKSEALILYSDITTEHIVQGRGITEDELIRKSNSSILKEFFPKDERK